MNTNIHQASYAVIHSLPVAALRFGHNLWVRHRQDCCLEPLRPLVEANNASCTTIIRWRRPISLGNSAPLGYSKDTLVQLRSQQGRGIFALSDFRITFPTNISNSAMQVLGMINTRCSFASALKNIAYDAVPDFNIFPVEEFKQSPISQVATNRIFIPVKYAFTVGK